MLLTLIQCEIASWSRDCVLFPELPKCSQTPDISLRPVHMCCSPIITEHRDPPLMYRQTTDHQRLPGTTPAPPSRCPQAPKLGSTATNQIILPRDVTSGAIVATPGRRIRFPQSVPWQERTMWCISRRITREESHGSRSPASRSLQLGERRLWAPVRQQRRGARMGLVCKNGSAASDVNNRRLKYVIVHHPRGTTTSLDYLWAIYRPRSQRHMI